jgi:hypothetical protein
MKTRYFEGRKQNCDICHATDLDVYFDMPYQGGHWANVCDKCRKKANNPKHPAGFKWIKGNAPKAAVRSENLPLSEKEQRHAQKLTLRQIRGMMMDGTCKAADGCIVETDGKCEHGYRSPLLVLGVI